MSSVNAGFDFSSITPLKDSVGEWKRIMQGAGSVSMPLLQECSF